ncbi:MAG TPA: hydroxysqualene dehydroxylase HpnE [Edaphobacter sp.]|nr:hydroxysqualene dehydroxylase HpnE [Edaphobacter sp.]
MSQQGESDVLVVGAGVAGMAAAVALAQAGARVKLLERRPYIGGRAYSYEHPALEETIDSQHVVLGCCTNLLDLARQAGMADSIRWYDDLVFLEPNGQRSWLRPGSLPAPMHQTMSFLKAPMLGLADKTAIASGLLRFLRGFPQDDSESFASWLKRTGQTERAIRHFWEPVVVGALNDTFERCSVTYAVKVFHESFLRSPEAGRLGVPAAPLSEFFAPIAELASRSGVDVRLKAGLESLEQGLDGRWSIRTADEAYTADAVVLATDFKQTRALLSQLPAAVEDRARIDEGFDAFIPAPITTIHLWYDRDVTGLDHAVLLDTRIQWLFTKSRIRRWAKERGSYQELVISASWPELEMGREEILSSAIAEFEMFFPAARRATLVKSGVLKEARATFSVTPGLDRYRPQQATPWKGLYLAGDWTATEWPSTMEGAVRSGRLAAGAVVGDRLRFMAPELAATGLMKLF